MSSVSGLTSTSWVIAVSNDDGENDGGRGGRHTHHIHNKQGGGGTEVASMSGGHDEGVKG